MIETRIPLATRILKQRDQHPGATLRPAVAPLDPTRPPALAPSAPLPAQRAVERCTTKEARFVSGEDGTRAVEVRCSCGEWTRVELQIAETTEPR